MDHPAAKAATALATAALVGFVLLNTGLLYLLVAPLVLIVGVTLITRGGTARWAGVGVLVGAVAPAAMFWLPSLGG